MLLAVMWNGCADIRSSNYGSVATQFISSPTGARIEIDGNYIGNAPVIYNWPRSYQNGARFRDQVTIKAFSSGAGQFPQRKFYESFGGVLPPIPQKVYFDNERAALCTRGRRLAGSARYWARQLILRGRLSSLRVQIVALADNRSASERFLGQLSGRL